MKSRIIICANPRAGSYREDTVNELAFTLTNHGHSVEIKKTTRAKELEKIACDIEGDVDILIICGGDGSINEALYGLWCRKKRMPYIAIIPAGTANILAHELKLFRNNEELVNNILQRKHKKVFFALANNRPFLLMCSVGADAEIVRSVTAQRKKYLGRLAYLVSAAFILYKRKSENLSIVIDEECQLTGKLAIITNSRFYAGPYTISNNTSVIKPGLELVILAKDNLFRVLVTMINLFVFGRDTGINRAYGKNVSITHPIGIPIQMDGEAFATTPLVVKFNGDSLKII